MDRGAWWARVHGVAKSRTGLKRLIRHAAFTEGARILELKQNKTKQRCLIKAYIAEAFPSPSQETAHGVDVPPQKNLA